METLEEAAQKCAYNTGEGYENPNFNQAVECFVKGSVFGFQNGAKHTKVEYEEKLRWIPVEERLPEKMQTEPSVSKVVQVKSKNFSEPFCAFYNHLYGIWLPYPFGSNSQIVGITEWRSFL